MGRELKRVPLDFDHPMNEVWTGYINPHHVARSCESCQGTGYSPMYRQLSAQWYGNDASFRPEDRGSRPFAAEHPIVRACAVRNVEHSPEYYGRGENAIQREAARLAAHFNRGWSHHLNADDVAVLIEAGRLRDLTHDWQPGTGWTPRDPMLSITPELVNEWSLSGMGHDGISQYIVVKAECARRGQGHQCTHCDGQGEHWPSVEAKVTYETWERTEPPAGDGYQIWETVSEGSPISPVFSTPLDLAKHMATTTWGADKGTSCETWLKFIQGPGWAPSLIGDAQGIRTGVAAG